MVLRKLILAGIPDICRKYQRDIDARYVTLRNFSDHMKDFKDSTKKALMLSFYHPSYLATQNYKQWMT